MKLMHFLMLKNGKLIIHSYDSTGGSIISVGDSDYIIDPTKYFRFTRKPLLGKKEECWGIWHNEGDENAKQVIPESTQIKANSEILQAMSRSEFMRRKYNPQEAGTHPLVYVAISIVVAGIAIAFAVFAKH